MRTAVCLKNDYRLQFRHGFYYVYALLSALYIIILRSLPEALSEFLLPLIVFTDPGVVGFFFIGGIIFLEKEENTLESLFITPIDLWDYLFSKVISLTTLAVVTSFIITIAVKGASFQPLLLFIGVVLTSFIFTFLGLVTASRFNTINKYFILPIIFILPLFLPLLDFFDIYKSSLFLLFPAMASLVLIRAGVGGEVSTGMVAYGICSLALWSFLAAKWAHNWFEKHIILKIGAG